MRDAVRHGALEHDYEANKVNPSGGAHLGSGAELWQAGPLGLGFGHDLTGSLSAEGGIDVYLPSCSHPHRMTGHPSFDD